MKVDIQTLIDSLANLRTFMREYERGVAESNDIWLETARTASIQAFEYNYEGIIKALRRRLGFNIASTEDLERMTFQDLIRTCAEAGWVDDPEQWFAYRKARNQTAHTYYEPIAVQVYAILPRFIQSVEHTIRELARDND